MPGLDDMARSFAAAGDGGMGGDTGSPDMEAQDPNAPEDGPEMDGGAESLEQGIMMVEAGLAGLPGDLAEKARKLVEGLKEISVQAEAAGGGSPDDQSMESPDGADAGSIESPSSPQVGGSAESYGT